jgi:hypothetical protein
MQALNNCVKCQCLVNGLLLVVKNKTSNIVLSIPENIELWQFKITHQWQLTSTGVATDTD